MMEEQSSCEEENTKGKEWKDKEERVEGDGKEQSLQCKLLEKKSELTPICISKIHSVEVVNQQYYKDECVFEIPGNTQRESFKTINQRGLLESADLKVILSLPMHYIERISYEEFMGSLSYQITNEKHEKDSNFNYKVQIQSSASIINTTHSTVGSSLIVPESSIQDTEDELLFSIEIPIYRGLVSLRSLPSFDELTIEHSISFTLTFDGCHVTSSPSPSSTCCWLIRLVLNQFIDLQIVSTSSQMKNEDDAGYNPLVNAYSVTRDYLSNSFRLLSSQLFSAFSNCRTFIPTIHSIPLLSHSSFYLFLSPDNADADDANNASDDLKDDYFYPPDGMDLGVSNSIDRFNLLQFTAPVYY